MVKTIVCKYIQGNTLCPNPRIQIEVYCKAFYKTKKKHHLKEGCGNPWAGQAKAIASFVILLIFLKWESSDICGLLPPIGSNMYVMYIIKNSKKSYLNEGVGKLWAGQIRVTEFFTSLVMLLELTSSENFGFWPPTGSMQQFFKDYTNILLKLTAAWIPELRWAPLDPSILQIVLVSNPNPKYENGF